MPQLMKHDALKNILIKSLASLPRTDFLSLCYMIPAPLQQQEPYKFIFKLDSLLSAGQYKRFWSEYRAREREMNCPGFDERIRSFIILVIGKLYTRISAQQLCDALNVDKEELERRVSQMNWQTEDDHKMVRIAPLVDEESAAARPQQSQIIDQVSKVLALV